MKPKQLHTRVPHPDDFKGRPLRDFLVSLVEWLRRTLETTAVGKPQTILVYTGGGGIPARSGTTAGSASCDIVTWNGTALDNSGNGSVTVYNAYGAAFTGSKYVWCVYWRGVYWGATQEC